MTELDRKLQQMATTNWPQFIQLLGPDAINAAKVCLLRQGNASYAQISIKLGISEKQARNGCYKCEVK